MATNKSPTDIWKPIPMLNSKVSDKKYYASQFGNIKVVNLNRNTEHIINNFNITTCGYARVTFRMCKSYGLCCINYK